MTVTDVHFPNSENYKHVIEAVDVVHDMKHRCTHYLQSLSKLEQYSVGRREKGSVSDAENRKSDLTAGRKLSKSLSSIFTMYRLVEASDFMSCSKMYLQTSKSIPELRKSANLDQRLVSELNKSFDRLKWLVSVAATNELEKLPENQNLVITALSSLILVCDQTVIEVYDNLLASISVVVNRNLVPSKTLTHAIVTYIECLYFVFITTRHMFQEDQPLAVPAYISRMFNDSDSQHLQLDGQQIREHLHKWYNEQKNTLSNCLKEHLSRQDIRGLLTALQSGSQCFAEKRVDWDLSSSHLLDTKCCLWNDSLKHHFQHIFTNLVHNSVDDCVSSLKLTDMKDISVSSFVWNTKTSGSDALEFKQLALTPECGEMTKDFRDKVTVIYSSLDILTKNQKQLAIVPGDDIKLLLSITAERFDAKLDALLQDLIQMTKKQSSKSLPACFMIRSVILMKSDLKKVYDLHPEGDRWSKLRDRLLDASHDWLSQHYSRTIEKFSVPFLKLSDISADQLTESSLPWQEISLQEEGSVEKGPVIRVPVYPSILYMDFLNSISREVNQVSGHSVPDAVCISIMQKAGIEIIRVYTETGDRIKLSQLPSSVLQRKALQCLFDLLMTKSLLIPVRDEKIRDSVIPRLTSLIKTFESLLDPFDLHLMSKTIHKHVGLAVRNSSQIISLILPVSVMETLRKTFDSKAVSSSPSDLLRGRHDNCPPLHKLTISK